MYLPSLTQVAMFIGLGLKVAADEIHLVNCLGGTSESLLVYCPTGTNSQNCNDNPPASGNTCILSTNSLHTWEGSSQSCRFSTGVTFTWNLASNAQSQPNYSSVGTGSNGYHSYDCRKDDAHVMLIGIGGETCYSEYYCLEQ